MYLNNYLFRKFHWVGIEIDNLSNNGMFQISTVNTYLVIIIEIEFF